MYVKRTHTYLHCCHHHTRTRTRTRTHTHTHLVKTGCFLGYASLCSMVVTTGRKETACPALTYRRTYTESIHTYAHTHVYMYTCAWLTVLKHNRLCVDLFRNSLHLFTCFGCHCIRVHNWHISWRSVGFHTHTHRWRQHTVGTLGPGALREWVDLRTYLAERPLSLGLLDGSCSVASTGAHHEHHTRLTPQPAHARTGQTTHCTHVCTYVCTAHSNG